MKFGGQVTFIIFLKVNLIIWCFLFRIRTLKKKKKNPNLTMNFFYKICYV
jgi:hypothetical protein